jgi:hypothetical protein
MRRGRIARQQGGPAAPFRFCPHSTVRRRRARLELLRAASFPIVTLATMYLCGLAVGQAQSRGIAGAPVATVILCGACVALMLTAVLIARLLVRLSSERVRALNRAQGRAHRRLRRAERDLALALEHGDDLRVRRAQATVARHAEGYRTWRQRYEESCEAPKLFAARRGYAWFLASMAFAVLATGSVLDVKAAGVPLPGPAHRTSPLLAATSLGLLAAGVASVITTLRSLHRGGLLVRLPWARRVAPVYRREQTFPHEVPVRSPVLLAASFLLVVGTGVTYAYIAARVDRVQDGFASAGLALTFLAGLTAYRALLGASLFVAIDDRWRASGLVRHQLRLTRVARRLARLWVGALAGLCVLFGGATVALLALMTFEGRWYEHLYVLTTLLTILTGAFCHAFMSVVNTWRAPTTDDFTRADRLYERLSNPVIRNQYLTMSLVMFGAGTACQLVGILG